MISVIIPAYNEQACIGETLRLALRQGGTFEVLVVDGGSTDRTCEIVERYDQVKLCHAAKGRALQMNDGARQARGDWLLFLRADTLLPRGAIERISSLIEKGRCRAGGFYRHFEGIGLMSRLISWLDGLRCRITGIVACHQGFFIERRLFEELGGFSENGVREDTDLCLRLRRCTKLTFLRPPVVIPPEQARRHPFWKTFAYSFLIFLIGRSNLSPRRYKAFLRALR